MVKRFINSEELFKKFIFWMLTAIGGLMISGVVAMINDHYTIKNHIDYSYRTNTYQNQQIEKTLDRIEVLQNYMTGSIKDIEHLKDNRTEDLKRLERVERKVFRGVGNDTFSISSFGVIKPDYFFIK